MNAEPTLAIPVTRAEAQQLDADDPLAAKRADFDMPPGVIYLDGNSLGPLPRTVADRLQQTVHAEWGKDLIRSWNDAGWIDLPTQCGAKISKLIGAASDEVIIADSVSVNIFKLAAALLKRQAGGNISVYADEFPTDGYVLQGLAAMIGADLRTLSAGDDPFANDADVLVVSAVNYKTAAIADIAAMELSAAQAGSAIIWDLSHAAGLLPLDMKRDGAKYAVGCGYKYLNGGPGAPAFIYVSNDTPALDQPLSGWMGHARPFAFANAYAPADGVKRFACGTPPVLSLSALDAALNLFDGVDLNLAYAKARALGDLFLSRALDAGLEPVSPEPGAPRGGHVSIRFDHGYEVMQALIASGVIGDFRAPDLMRFGFSPLCLTYAEAWDAAETLMDILEQNAWRRPEFAKRGKVT